MSEQPSRRPHESPALTPVGQSGFRSRSVSLYRTEPTAAVLAAIEYWSWWLAELATDMSDPDIQTSSITFAEFHLSEAVSELERRDHLRNHPAAPPWPGGWRSAIPDAERVKDHLNILGYYRWLGATPVRRGSNWVARCDLPTHPGPDTNPSLRITENGRGWYCHPCGFGGDLLKLHCARTGLAFPDALAELAAVSGTIVHPEDGHGDRN